MSEAAFAVVVGYFDRHPNVIGAARELARMSDKLVEQVHGHADVKRQGSDDIVVPNARYSLRVWQEYKPIRTLSGTDQVPGLKRVNGTIEAPMNSEMYIDLPDGRRLNFFVSDAHGSVARMSGSTFP